MPYSEHQKKQIAYIHAHYQQAGLGDIPPLLQTEAYHSFFSFFYSGEPIQGKIPVKKETFEFSHVNAQLQHGILRPYAESLLIKLCAYEKERSQRRIGAGAFDDPTHLLLAEMKHWIIHTLSASPSTPELADEIQRRITYLKHIETSDLFPASAWGHLHLGATLVELVETLQTVKANIKSDIEHTSAERTFAQFFCATKNTLQHLTQYAYLIFRPELSDDFTFANLRHPHGTDKPMQRAIKTQSGQLLLGLINSPPFLNLFPDQESVQVKSPDEINSPLALDRASTELTNPFLRHVVLREKPSTSDDGIYPPLRTHPNSWLHLIQLHALLWELACFTAIGQDLQWLAQQGGDGLIYGLAHPSIHAFLNHYVSLMHAISHQLNVIHGFASSTYKEKKRAASQNPWLTSFTKADALYRHIEMDRERCHSDAMRLATQTASGIDNYRQRNIQARTATILERVDAFSQRMSGLFGEPQTKTRDSECTRHTSLSNQPAVLAKPLFYTASKPRKPTAISDNTRLDERESTRHRRTRTTQPSLTSNPTDFTMPDYIQNFIVNFNEADEVAHAHAQWQTYFRWQKDKGGKGKPALLRIKPEKQAVWLLAETNAFVRESRCAEESFLYAFDQNWHLPTASEFVIQITHAIKQFEANDLDHAKPHGFVAWVLGEDQLWETRHHELFYLKYLCVMAASPPTDTEPALSNAEQKLHAFIDTFSKQSPWKYFSDYRKLRDALLLIEPKNTTPRIESTPSLDRKGESEKAAVLHKNQPRDEWDDDEDISILLDDWRDGDERQDPGSPPFYDSLFDDDDSLLVSPPVNKRTRQKTTSL